MSGWFIGFLAGGFFWMPVGFLLAALLTANREHSVPTPPLPTEDLTPGAEDLLFQGDE